MGFRRTLGNIIIVLSVIGLIINSGILATGYAECELNIRVLPDADCSKLDEFYLNFGIGFFVSLIWLGIGFAIRGRPDNG